ncbi:hypothetical protein VPH35_038914 [Triticum aestivum]
MKRPKPCEDCNPQRLGDEFVAAEIVSRLPVREAARCATLSKRFRRLLTTTTDFWLRRRCLGANLPCPHVACFLRYCIDGQETSPIPAFDFVGPALAVKRVVGSPPAMHFYAGTCNGLVLLTTSVHDGHRYIDGILFNPATRKEDEAAIRLSLPTARGVKSRRRFVGFGYGAKCKAYKVLVCVDQESISHGAVEGGGGGKLMVISFGGHRQDQNQKPRTVLFLPGKSLLCPACLYMDDEDGKGKIYLLANIGNGGKPSAVLAFDVDDEAISTIALPPGKHVKSRLMEIRGRLCVCMRDDAKQNILLWALTPAGSGHRWEQLCVLADHRSASAPWTRALHGAWDCDGILFALFRGSIACMYDLREQGTGTAGADEPGLQDELSVFERETDVADAAVHVAADPAHDGAIMVVDLHLEAKPGDPHGEEVTEDDPVAAVEPDDTQGLDHQLLLRHLRELGRGDEHGEIFHVLDHNVEAKQLSCPLFGADPQRPFP